MCFNDLFNWTRKADHGTNRKHKADISHTHTHRRHDEPPWSKSSHFDTRTPSTVLPNGRLYGDGALINTPSLALMAGQGRSLTHTHACPHTHTKCHMYKQAWRWISTDSLTRLTDWFSSERPEVTHSKHTHSHTPGVVYQSSARSIRGVERRVNPL